MADAKFSNHNVILKGRAHLTVSGVSDVDRFDEQTVVAYTCMGELTVKGKNLHIDKLNIDTGDLEVSGTVVALMYTDEREKSGFWGRLFR